MYLPPFAVICYACINLPAIFIIVAPRGEHNIPYSFLYVFLVICAVIIILRVCEDHEYSKVQPSRKKKLNVITFGLLGVLLCLIIQNAISYVLLYQTNYNEKIENLICVLIISTAGVASSIFTFLMCLYSTGFFHIIDCFDGYSFIIFFVTPFFMSSFQSLSIKWLFYLYILPYIYVFKTLFIIFLDQTGIAFLNQEEYYVNMKTWRGREYRGKIVKTMQFMAIYICDPEIKKNGEWIRDPKKYMACFFMNLMWFERIPCLHEPGSCDCSILDNTSQHSKEKPKNKLIPNQNHRIFPAAQPPVSVDIDNPTS